MSKARTASRISGNCGIRSSGASRPVRLVFGIDLGAEGLFRLVEHHREMRRLLVRLHLGQQLPQHVAEAEHGIDLQAVGFAGERRQRVIGAEDVAGAVDQEDVVARLERPRGIGGGRRGSAARPDLDLAGAAWPECGLPRGLSMLDHVEIVRACGLASDGSPHAMRSQPARRSGESSSARIWRTPCALR